MQASFNIGRSVIKVRPYQSTKREIGQSSKYFLTKYISKIIYFHDVIYFENARNSSLPISGHGINYWP